MDFCYLKDIEIEEIAEAAKQARLGVNDARSILLNALNQGFALGLGNVGNALFQLHADLNAMNRVEQLDDGSVPLRDWLRKAGSLAKQMARREADVFTKYEAQVEAHAPGQMSLPEPLEPLPFSELERLV